MKDRLRLFDGTVTPTVLYGCSSWTLTVELENRLRRTQRQMLRMIINPPRRRSSEDEQHNKHTPAQTAAESHEIPKDMTTHDPTTQIPTRNDSDSDGHDVDSEVSDIQIPTDTNNESTESWVDWIKRSTHEAENLIQSLGIEDWISRQRRRKWRWAHRVALDEDKWTYKAALWNPSLSPRNKARREQGRPRRRWADDINEHVTNMSSSNNNDNDNSTNHSNETNDQHWTTKAKDKRKWGEWEESFVRH